MSDDVVVACPYCGEHFGTLLDTGAASDETWEDCAVCCRPILLRWQVAADGSLETLEALTDSDV